MQVFKAVNKISVYDILTNKFNVNLSQKLKPEHCIPVKQFFEECNFFYETSIDNNKISVHRIKYWFDNFILLIQIFNLIKCLIWIFWDEEDPIIRLYGGDLDSFLGLNTKFIAIPQAGVSLYVLSIFCLLKYSSNLNWLSIFDPIEGRQSFVKSKIFIEKSAKNLIRFSLFLITTGITTNYFTLTFVMFILVYFPSVILPFQLFALFALPWACTMVIWIYHMCSYGFASLIVLIPCYYYELRLNHLDLYLNLYLKRKSFIRINQRIIKLLDDYAEIINEMNQLNKFVSKLIFFILLFCSSTLVFLIYNMIYIKHYWLMYLFYLIFAADVTFVISMILISAVRLSSKINRNKRNLMTLIYVKNLQIKNRIKVSCNVKMTMKLIVF